MKLEVQTYNERSLLHIIFDRRVYYCSLLASFVLLILTIGTNSFYQFPARTFYYISSLSIFYWIGIGFTLFSIIISFRVKTNDRLKLIAQLMLAAYLFSLPAFTYENPRFKDVYDHGTGALLIVKSGGIENGHLYSRDYPIAFLFMASSLIITGIDPDLFYNFYQAFLPLLVITLIYLLAKTFAPRYALYTPLAFNAMFFQDQGHFSPQAVALPLYLILWICLAKMWLGKNRGSLRSTALIAIVTIFAINLSSPTTSYFLFVNIAGMLLMAILLARFTLNKDTIRKKIFMLMLLHATILFAWATYGTEKLGIEKLIDKIETDTTRYLQSTYAFPIAPESSYQFLVYTHAMAAAFILISSIVFFIFLFKYKGVDIRTLTVISGLIVGSIIVMPLALFHSGTYSERVLMFAAIPWSILFGSFMSMQINRRTFGVTRNVAFVCIIAFIILIPITKYGSEATTYFSSSEIFMANLVAEDSSESTLMTLRTGKNIFNYFSIYNDKQIETGQIVPKFRAIDEKTIARLDDKISEDPNLKVALTNMERNVYSLKYHSDETTYGEYIKARFNLIANSGPELYALPRT